MNFWFYNQAMQFLSISRRRTDAFPAEAFTPELVDGEAQRAKELYAAIIWEAASEAEARGAIASLPLAKAGMLEITTFLALEPYAGFVQ